MSVLRVANYYPWVYLTSGIERTILEVARRSRHQHVVFTNHFDRENTYPELSQIPLVELRRVSVRRGVGAVLHAGLTIATQRLPLEGFDVLIVHCDGLGDAILTRNRRRLPTLCFCHTPLRAVFDPVYREQASRRYTGLRHLPFAFFSNLFKVVDRRLWAAYDAVLFNSEETMRRAGEGGLLSGQARYSVLHPGCDITRFKMSTESRPSFLVPGRIMWTKNVQSAIGGFLRFKKQYFAFSEFSLVVCGRVDEKSRSYLRQLRELSSGRQDVHFVVNPSDDALLDLYRTCYGVVSVAENEDWGMVVLEANACGKPVICTNRGGLAESQVHNVTALLVDPQPAAVAHAMAQLAFDRQLAERLGREGRKHCLQYDWAHFTEALDDVLEQLAAERATSQRRSYAKAV